MKLTDYLDHKHIRTLERIGDTFFPGDENLPRFSASGCVEAAVYVIANLPAGEIAQLKLLLKMMGLLSDKQLGGLMRRGADNSPKPGIFAQKLRQAYSSLEDLTRVAYYAASLRLPERIEDTFDPVEPEHTGGDSKSTLVIIATLDTRGDEVVLARQMIEARGHQAIVIDMGVMGTPEGPAEYTRSDVAQAGGRSIDDLIADARAGADRGKATDVMIAGARKIAFDLVRSGKADGIFGMGGSTAASSAIRVMKGLPIGMPKVLLTSMAKTANIGEEDITVMQSPVDLVGLNSVVKKVLSNAVGAIAGMAEQRVVLGEERPRVGLTALGVTTPAVMKILQGLEDMGYEGVVFHALTDKCDEMIRSGMIGAMIDVTTFEMLGKIFYSDDQIKGATGADFVNRTRLRGAEIRGIPQIIAPGGIDLHIIPGISDPSMLPKNLQGRATAQHGPDVILVRTGAMENQLIGRALAERVNRASGPAAVLIPTQGFSDASRAGSPMHSAQVDRSFGDALKAQISDPAAMEEIDCHINDDAFAAAVLRRFAEMMG